MEYHFPSGFIDAIQSSPGFEKDAFIAAHENREAPVSIRLNPFKRFNPGNSVLKIKGKVPWSSEGYYLDTRPSFTLDPFFHGGAYYVQEASSMFLEYVIRQTVDLTKPVMALDCCAAPGGKSTLIHSLLSNESVLISNEVIKSRSNILAENITKWGAGNIVVTNNDPSHFQKLPGFFDLLVVDAPCSGSGLFRKDNSAMDEWSQSNVQHCNQRQQRILHDCLPALKENGILIYSTCSYSELENECIADWLITDQQMHPVKLTLDPSWNLVESCSTRGGIGYRFYPDKIEGEGFFISCFKKTINPGPGNSISKLKLNFASKNDTALVSEYISSPENYEFLNWNDDIIAIPSIHIDPYKQISSTLYLKKAFINMGSLARKELIPSHEWALSTIRSEKIPGIELSLYNALQYLRKQDIDIESEHKGWAIIKFNDISLGLAKLLSNRVNNYYPKEWRILNK